MVYISGGGVVRDTPLIPGGPLPDGYRFRVSPTDNPRDDFDIFLSNGELHIVGHYRTIHAERHTPNHVGITAVRP